MVRCARISAVVLGFLSFGSAAAVAAPPPPPAVWNWTGFYTGANVGYGWGSSKSTVSFADVKGPLSTLTGTVRPEGVIGGGQIGYNWQFGNWIAGLEADFQGSDQRGSLNLVCPAGVCSGTAVTSALTEKLEWFGTVRPRLGFNVTPNTMLYATGGLAYGRLTDSGTIADGAGHSTPFSFAKTSTGWTVGGGAEGQLWDRWTWKLEYLYLELEEPSSSGAIQTSIPCVVARVCGGVPITAQIDPWFKDNIIRLGINYKWQ